MQHTQKIATCCYCGTRAALVLKGRERHELACSNCGAPLHELKMLKAHPKGERELVRRMPDWQGKSGRKSRKRKKQRSLSQRMMHELWDAAEDIFDILD